MADRFFIDPETLNPLLHRADAPHLIDLRDAEDATSDPRLLPGARLGEGDLPPGPVVCLCQKGGKLSQLAAAGLRAEGREARVLRGGHLAWVAAGLPLVAAARPERWVMPLDPDWAGLAALWVLRRLVDRAAPVRAVERDWSAQATAVWGAGALPDDPHELAASVGLKHPSLQHLTGGPEALLAGRLARVDPVEALDLVDDWLARPGAAA